MDVPFTELLGKVVTKIEKSRDEDEITFTTSGGEAYRLYHVQECCEDVSIEDINGELADLLNTPILQAEESSNKDWPVDTAEQRDCHDSFLWTFYKLATMKGHVVIRWLGSSNSYYGESVSFERVNKQ